MLTLFTQTTSLSEGSPQSHLAIPIRLPASPLTPSNVLLQRPQLVIVTRRHSSFDESMPNMYPIPDTSFGVHEEALQTRIENDLSMGWGPFEVVDCSTFLVGEIPQEPLTSHASSKCSGDDPAPCTDRVKLWLDPPCAGAIRRFVCVNSEDLWPLPRIGGWQVVGVPHSFPWTRYLVMLVPVQGQSAQWTWMSLGELRRQLPEEWATLVHHYRSTIEISNPLEAAEVKLEEMNENSEEGDSDEDGGEDEDEDEDEGECDYEDYEENEDEGEDEQDIFPGLGTPTRKRSWDQANNEGHRDSITRITGSKSGIHQGHGGWHGRLAIQREVEPRGNASLFSGNWSWANARSVNLQTSSSLSPNTKVSSYNSASLGFSTIQGFMTSTAITSKSHSLHEQGTNVCKLTTFNCLSGQLSSPCQEWPFSNATCCTSGEVHLARINSAPFGPSNRLKRARMGTGAQLHMSDQNCNTIADEHYRHKCRNNSTDWNIEFVLKAGNLPAPRRFEPPADGLVLDLDRPLSIPHTTQAAFSAQQQASTGAALLPLSGFTSRAHPTTYHPFTYPSECSSNDSPMRSLAPSPLPPPTQPCLQHSTRTESHPVTPSATVREQYGSVYLQLHGKEVTVRRSARLGARGLADIPQSLIQPLSRVRLMKDTR